MRRFLTKKRREYCCAADREPSPTHRPGPLLTLSGGGQQGRPAAAGAGRSSASHLEASASSAETTSSSETEVGAHGPTSLTVQVDEESNCRFARNYLVGYYMPNLLAGCTE